MGAGSNLAALGLLFSGLAGQRGRIKGVEGGGVEGILYPSGGVGGGGGAVR